MLLLAYYEQNARTALAAASNNGHLEAVRLLLAHPGTDSSLQNRVSSLVAHHALPTSTHYYSFAQDGVLPMFGAVMGGHIEVVKHYLSQPGADVNITGGVSSEATNLFELTEPRLIVLSGRANGTHVCI